MPPIIRIEFLYFVSITAVVYAFSGLIFIFIIPNPTMPALILVTAISFGMMLLISTLTNRSNTLWKKSRIAWEDIIHALAFSGLGVILVALIEILTGNSITPAISNSKCNPIIYPVLFWTINGLIVALFYHALTYELFNKYGKSAGVLASTLLFSLNYNAPLLSGIWNLWDILFFGLALAYSYSARKNPLALLFPYIIYEVPLWSCILQPMGKEAFTIYMISRVAISSLALVAVMWNSLRKNHP